MPAARWWPAPRWRFRPSPFLRPAVLRPPRISFSNSTPGAFTAGPEGCLAVPVLRQGSGRPRASSRGRLDGKEGGRVAFIQGDLYRSRSCGSYVYCRARICAGAGASGSAGCAPRATRALAPAAGGASAEGRGARGRRSAAPGGSGGPGGYAAGTGGCAASHTARRRRGSSGSRRSGRTDRIVARVRQHLGAVEDLQPGHRGDRQLRRCSGEERRQSHAGAEPERGRGQLPGSRRSVCSRRLLPRRVAGGLGSKRAS